MAVFDWMEPAKEIVNASTEFRKLGSVDIRLAFKSGKHCKLVHFRGFKVDTITPMDPDTPFAYAELLIEMPTRNWNSYLRRRSLKRAPSLSSMNIDRVLVTASNPLNRRLFERYHKSILAFVDIGAQWAASRANV